MSDRPLADSAFVVLALLAEGDMHGYEIQRLVHRRGFRLWTGLRRSAIYNALLALEKDGHLRSTVTAGEGAERKVYRITERGRRRLCADAVHHLSAPDHPRNEIDLGIYALPFVPKEQVDAAFEAALQNMLARREFLAERLAWCTERGLRMPALAFERPLVALDAEIGWLRGVARELAAGGASGTDWVRFGE